jgi:hypothetical protein
MLVKQKTDKFTSSDNKEQKIASTDRRGGSQKQKIQFHNKNHSKELENTCFMQGCTPFARSIATTINSVLPLRTDLTSNTHD